MSGEQTVAGVRRYLAEVLGEFAAMEFDRMLTEVRREGAAEVTARVEAVLVEADQAHEAALGKRIRAALIPGAHPMTTKADLHAQIRDLLEEREELLTEIRRLQGIAADVREAERTAEHWEGLWTVAIERAEAAEAQVTEKAAEIRRLQRGNHPAGRALRAVDEAAWRDLQVALDARDAEHEGGGGA